MVLELFITGCLVVLSVSNFIIYRHRISLIKMAIGLLLSLLYPVFKLIGALNPFIWILMILEVVAIIALSVLFFPKKVTKNITEYDYFELEKSFNSIRNEKEDMRQRYLKTISLIDEGIVFYEDGLSSVILSDHAHDILGGKYTRLMESHLECISPQDREEYTKTLQRASKSNEVFDLKYRVLCEGGHIWVEERGCRVGVDGKRPMISSIRSLDSRKYKKTQNVDLDSIPDDDSLLLEMKKLLESGRNFVYCIFELSNIPKINEKYSREVGTIMIMDYIKTIRNFYQRDIKKFYRIGGIRFACIINDEMMVDEILNDSKSKNSEIFNTRIKIGDSTELVKPNFVVVSISGVRDRDALEIYRFANKRLDETIASSDTSCTVYRE